jgi:hypothetical protein
MTDQVSCSYKTTGKTIALYILIFAFLNSKQAEGKDFELNSFKHSPNAIYSSYLHAC